MNGLNSTVSKAIPPSPATQLTNTTKPTNQPTEPIYRLAEQEWKHFIEAFTDVLIAADPQVPPLPPKDVVHRIYRDVRRGGVVDSLRC